MLIADCFESAPADCFMRGRADCLAREPDQTSDVPRGAAVVPTSGSATTTSVSFLQGVYFTATMADMTGDAAIEIISLGSDEYVVSPHGSRTPPKVA